MLLSFVEWSHIGLILAQPMEGQRILSIRGNNALDSEGNEYWVVSYEIEIDKEGFIKKILNAGLNFKPSGDYKRAIKYADLPNFAGTEKEGADFVNDPQKLSESGAIIDDESAEEPFYPEFAVYFSKNWNTLSIPAST